MKRIRSFANRPRLERQEKPKRARVKKKMPSLFWKPEISLLKRTVVSVIQDVHRKDARYVVEEETANDCKEVSILLVVTLTESHSRANPIADK